MCARAWSSCGRWARKFKLRNPNAGGGRARPLFSLFYFLRPSARLHRASGGPAGPYAAFELAEGAEPSRARAAEADLLQPSPFFFAFAFSLLFLGDGGCSRRRPAFLPSSHPQGPYIGFRAGSGKMLQVRKKLPHQLCFFNSHFGVWEQWEVRAPPVF